MWITQNSFASKRKQTLVSEFVNVLKNMYQSYCNEVANQNNAAQIYIAPQQMIQMPGLQLSVKSEPQQYELLHTQSLHQVRPSRDLPQVAIPNIVEGTIQELKQNPVIREQLKGSEIMVLDGKHQGRKGTFTKFNGSNCYIAFPDNTSVAVPVVRKIRVYL